MRKNEEILLKYLDDYGLDIFSKNELKEANIMNHQQLTRTIKKLIDSSYIDIIERGKYCKHNFRDSFVIGSFVVDDGVISYWNAINFHGLTEQIPNVVFVKTSKAKRNCVFFGIRYIFSTKPKKCISGFQVEGYGNHKYMISDVERTIVDAFDKPRLSGGYAEIVKAFHKARLSAKKLVKYCKEENNISLTKRLAFLADILEKPKMELFFKYANNVLNEKYTLFEIDGEKTGKTNKKWRIIQNISKEEIIEMSES